MEGLPPEGFIGFISGELPPERFIGIIGGELPPEGFERPAFLHQIGSDGAPGVKADGWDPVRVSLRPPQDRRPRLHSR